MAKHPFNMENTNINKLLFGLFLSFWAITSSFAQMQNYTYKCEISGITDTWHSLTLPNELYASLRPDLADLRIMGITAENDTVEAPYLRQSTREMKLEKEIPFRQINSTNNEKGYYFTFEMPAEMAVNNLFLAIEQSNFDWKVKVEGSQNQHEWFTLSENYRILGIQNAQTSYKFTNIVFPDAKYRFVRICIDSKIKPVILAAKIHKQTFQAGLYQNYAVKNLKNTQNKQAKQTIIELTLPTSVPVSYLKFAVKNTFDYYRPIHIEYLVDSSKTEKGYVYQYNNIASGTLTSLEKNELKFGNVVCQKLKITIENADNEPLTIESVEVKGTPDKLVARFTQKATYFLVYGNTNAVEANYDIGIFQDKIPATLTEISLGKVEKIAKISAKKVEPLFQNKVWLWAIMGAIIGVLGWFSFKMMKNR